MRKIFDEIYMIVRKDIDIDEGDSEKRNGLRKRDVWVYWVIEKKKRYKEEPEQGLNEG